MYKIIGADGNEYGPVTTDQLRQWIREGRANGQTMARAEGSAESKSLSTFPEFADLFGASAPVVEVPPPIAVGASAEQILARGHEVDIGSCISRGWGLVKNNFWRLVGTTFLVFLLLGGMGWALRMVVNLMFDVPFITPHVGAWGAMRTQWRGILISSVWNLFISGPLLGGLYNYYLKLIRGQPATLADAFAGFSGAFGALMLAHLISALLTTIGCFLCILPGIYLGVAWKFALPLVIDKRLGFWEAMELSRKVITRQWWSLFALVILSALITVCGLLACCIGIFATTPIGIAAILYAYEDIFGAHTTAQAS
jgi:hypothetical protein